ncbi:MAG: hypothetical protein CTY25_00720, partial [Methylobacterium sp.]
GQTLAPNATGVTLDRGAGTRAFDGIDVIPGQRGVYWNGALRFTAPQVAVVTPPPPPVVAPVVKQIGQWKELVADVNGKIIESEYKRVAANYNAPEIVDYRLGPKAADFGNATNTAPTLWGPDLARGQGLWPFGTLPATNPGESAKCLPPPEQPRSDQEELARGLKGNGWLVGGQHIFLPDNPGDPDYKFGISNTRGGDGSVFDTGGLCMRMIASWFPDWWNRNNIATPAQPEIRNLATRRADLPLVPVAIARGRANASQISFAAFKDGTIAPIAVGNTAPEFFDTTGIRLPAGMVPTAMAVTPYNEFLVVSVWDTNTVSGKLAFIALRPRQMAVGSPSQTPNSRWYWGVPGAWTIRGMKLIGMIDLPFAAPSSLDVSNNIVLGNPRGHGNNDDPAQGDLSRQSARDLWRNSDPLITYGNDEWSKLASGGYAIVASRAENKVSFVDMTPLYQYYRTMYLTTQANYDRTADASLTDPNKWPFSFAVAPSQTPTIVSTIAVDQPTSVSAGIQTRTIFGIDRGTWFGESGNPGWSAKEGWSGMEPQRVLGRSRAFIATMDGTVQILNVQGLNFPNSPVGKTVSSTPLATFKAGRNSTFAFTNGISTAPDDLFLVSRGDRNVTFAFPDGRIQGVLRDSRLVDPVGGAVTINQAGFGGTGPGKAVFAPIINITDFNGKTIHTYAVDPKRGYSGSLAELYPFQTPSGYSPYLWGSTAPFPGKPFMIDMEEII